MVPVKAVVTQPRIQSPTGRNVEGQEMAGHGPQREGDAERASAGCPPGPRDSLLSTRLHESRVNLHPAREADKLQGGGRLTGPQAHSGGGGGNGVQSQGGDLMELCGQSGDRRQSVPAA